jgi:hypothetical protein
MSALLHVLRAKLAPTSRNVASVAGSMQTLVVRAGLSTSTPVRVTSHRPARRCGCSSAQADVDATVAAMTRSQALRNATGIMAPLPRTPDISHRGTAATSGQQTGTHAVTCC